ncbi:MAG TPA: 23S rRNA (cytidine(2498)-2'-O)-methyltransferase RlmM, partial [Zoogloea sp.]|nr:23S rRNA (cytidine(2498)-2'-O)-methyltransferase RlmM [Zoogloea sp.]
MQPAPTPCLSTGILVQCRPGFEPDASLELQAAARAARVEGSITEVINSGFALFQLSVPAPRDELRRRLDLSRLVFSRQGFQLVGSLEDLPEKDRLSPLMSAITALGERFSALLLETPDTNDGKQQSGFL